MSSLEELRQERLAKLERLKEAGVEPYPAETKRDISVGDFLAQFESLEEKAQVHTVAGRLTALRTHGGSAFADLYDGTGSIQLFFKKDEVGEDTFTLFESNIDLGDFIEVTGTPFTTKRGEKSVLVSGWTLLSKSLLPLPEKWHGLQDTEERFRKRYLDLLSNRDIKEMFERKAHFWDVTRRYLKDAGFMEVETPTLEVTTGGAEATPFRTHHNDFDLDVYLRISIGELWQKRLMAAGFEKTFEIGRAYRNEGTSPEHLQEFTNMEFYWAYADYEDGMDFVQELYRAIAQEVYGRTQFEYRGHTFDFSDEWQRIDYCEEVKRQTGIDIQTASEGDIEAYLKNEGVEYDGDNRERLVDTLWKVCRKNISGPAFLINHPKIIAPLAKARPEDPDTVERFQPIIAGSEVGNGYSELNNPLEQRKRFEYQQKLRDEGDDEAMMPDWEFVEMLEHGMPPTCGFGFGERLFAILENKTIRETQLFPLMKPRPEDTPQ